MPNCEFYHQYYFQGMHKHKAGHLFVNEEEALLMIKLKD